MPIRAYQPLQTPCRLCGDGFEIVHASGEAPLSHCPRCGSAVTLRAVTSASTPRVTKPLSVSDAKAAGFSVLKRTPGGEFEKQ
jgi:hypothetical protein